MFKNGFYYGSELEFKNIPKNSSIGYSISIPGFRTLLDPNQPKFKKSIWAFFMLVFLGLTLFQIGERTQNFLSYPVDMEYKFVSQSKIEFPSITVCPYNGFAGRNVLATIKNRSVDSVHDLLTFPDMDLDKIWNLTDIDFDSVLPACVYGMAKNNCKGNDNWKKQITVLGICYTFDSEPVPYAGVLSAFFMQIEGSNLHEWFPNSDFRSKNVIVAIHSKHADVSYNVIFDGFEASLGTTLLINYIHNVNIFANSSGKPCYTHEYHERCKLGCYDSFTKKGLSCRLPFMKTSTKPLCKNADDFRKMYRIPVHENLFFNDVDTCLATCGQPCQQTAYDENVETKAFINESFIRIQVNPLRVGKAIMTENMSYSIFALTCDIGAILGLYMGVSVLTITEFIEVFIDFIKKKYPRRVKKMEKPLAWQIK